MVLDQFGLIGFSIKDDSKSSYHAKNINIAVHESTINDDNYTTGVNSKKDTDEDKEKDNNVHGSNRNSRDSSDRSYSYKQNKCWFNCEFQSNILFNLCHRFANLDEDDTKDIITNAAAVCCI